MSNGSKKKTPRKTGPTRKGTKKSGAKKPGAKAQARSDSKIVKRLDIRQPAKDDSHPRFALAGWLVLTLAFIALTARVWTSERDLWPSTVGDESTYLMAAQSLAFDQDFRYDAGDYERFRNSFPWQPEGLILQSPDKGETLLFAKPIFYPLAVAPFLRLDGLRGAMLFNTGLLALTCFVVSWRLRRRVGDVAALFVAVLVFASVTFAHVFWIHADLFMMCLMGLGLSLAFDDRRGTPSGTSREERERTGFSAPLGIALLAIVTLSRPFYGLVLLPVMLYSLTRKRRLGLLLAPALLVVTASILFNFALRKTWTSYGGERQGFYSYTGYPEVGDSEGWRETVAERGTNSWTGSNTLPFKFDLRQFLWNGYYLTLGRHVGLIPYFLPVLLCLWAFRWGEVRTTLAIAILLAIAVFMVVRPFNFFGGGGALANRYFLPLFAATWFLAGRRVSPVPIVLTAVLAAPFLWPLWSAPDAFLRTDEGGYRYVSTFSQRWLPHETTQSHLKPSGQEDFHHGKFWIKPLTVNINQGASPPGTDVSEPHTSEANTSETDDLILWGPGEPGELLLGTSIPLRDFELRVARTDGAIFDDTLDLSGADLRDQQDLEDGTRVLQFSTRRPTAKHPMWWTEDDVYLYRFRIRRTLSRSTDPGQPLDLRFKRLWPDTAAPTQPTPTPGLGS